MRMFLKNNPAKLNHDPIWNSGALGFWKASPQQEQEAQKQEQPDE